MGRLKLETIMGTDGVPYQFMVDSQTRVPIFIMSNPGTREQGWRQVYLKDIVNIPGGLEIVGSENRMYPDFFNDVNMAVVNCIWSVLEPQDNQYDWSTFDADVKDMVAHGLKVRSQSISMTPSWAYPEWIKNGNFSRAEIEKIWTDHITTVIQHGKALGVTEWTIVSEPFKPGEREENDILYKAFGGYEYIDIAYIAARKADPNAILIYDDYENHTSLKPLRPGQQATAHSGVELTKQIISRLRKITVVGDDGIARRVLDVVGAESHLGGWVGVPPDMTDVEQTLKSYGMPISISGFGVRVDEFTGTSDEILRQQAQLYSDFLRAEIKSGAVRDLVFWGLTDTNNWLYSDQSVSTGTPTAAPTLYDMNNRPKLSYYEVVKVLYEQLETALK